MRGKKADPIFISEFIQESVRAGSETPDQIVGRAKKMIEQIDEEIKAIESKKVIRSKLLDVVLAFEKPSNNKLEDAKLLPFFKIQYPQTCKDICELLKYEAKSLPVRSLASVGFDAAEHNFCIKQMLEAKVIARVGDELVKGECFDEYVKFVLRQ